MRGGGEHPLDDPLRLRPPRVPRQPRGDRASCRAARRCRCGTRAGCSRRRRSTSCGRPSPTRARRPSAGRRSRRRARAGRCRSRAGGRCWSRASRPAASRRRARARSSRPARRPRTPRRTAAAAPRPRVSSRVGELAVAPHLARELGHPALRVVDVALHLARRDRRRRDRAVAEALRVARVLPGLVVEPASALARTRRSRRRRGRRTRRSSASAASAGSLRSRTSAMSSVHRHTSDSEDEVERRRVDRAVVALEPACAPPCRCRTSWTIFPGSASIDGSSSFACRSASTSSAVRASSGPNRSVCRHVMIVSRPKTVMNHGTPAPGSLPIPELLERMRSDARSDDRLDEARATASSHDARSCGTRSCHAASESRTRPTSSPNRRSAKPRRDLLAVRQREDVDVRAPSARAARARGVKRDVRVVALAPLRRRSPASSAAGRAVSAIRNWLRSGSYSPAGGVGSGSARIGSPSAKS